MTWSSSWDIIQRINLKDTIQKEQLDLHKALKQEKADSHNAMHTQNNDVGFTGEDSAKECFPPCCLLQHYANTDPSTIQVTFEEVYRAQS